MKTVRVIVWLVIGTALLVFGIWGLMHEFRPRSSVTASESGGFQMGERSFFYLIENGGGMQYVVGFDCPFYQQASYTNHYNNHGGIVHEARDGRLFALRHAGPEKVVIDGAPYDLAEGNVFLVVSGADKNECRQLPLHMVVPVSAFRVKDFIHTSAKNNADLAKFLGNQ